MAKKTPPKPPIAPTHKRRRIVAASGAGAPPPSAAIEEEKPAAAPARDLADPKTQYEILNPDTVLFPIVIDGVATKIVVPTKFTLREIDQLRVHDDISALNELINIELIKMIGPDSFSQTLLANPRYYEVALARGVVRQAVRELVAKASYFYDPEPNDADGKPKRKRRPTVDQIATGLEDKMVSAIGLLLVANYLREVQDQKKEPTA